MKGSVALELGTSIKNIIRLLDTLSDKNFPIDTVRFELANLSYDINIFEPYVFYSIEAYTRNLVYHSSVYELLILCWMPGQKTPIHGHEGEKCWIKVLEGSLDVVSFSKSITSDGLVLEQESIINLKPGDVSDPLFIVQVENRSDKKAVSLHLHTRPMYECDVYEQKTLEKNRMTLTFFSMFGKIINF